MMELTQQCMLCHSEGELKRCQFTLINELRPDIKYTTMLCTECLKEEEGVSLETYLQEFLKVEEVRRDYAW